MKQEHSKKPSGNSSRVKSSGRGTSPEKRGDKAAFANKKSVFLSREKQEKINTDRPKSKPATGKQSRHLSYEGREADRLQSGEYLSKERLSRPRRQFASKGQSTSKVNKREGIRLNKFIAHAGVCSRREADNYITAGSVQVNGKVISEMGYMVQKGDVVKFDGVELKEVQNKVYILLNKPKNYITTTDDPDKRRTVMELMTGATKERIYPVGRLDRATTGLLLFTNDGDLAKKNDAPFKSNP